MGRGLFLAMAMAFAVPATIVVAASEKLGPGRGQEGDHTVDLVWRKGILVIFPISLDRKIEIHRRAENWVGPVTRQTFVRPSHPPLDICKHYKARERKLHSPCRSHKQTFILCGYTIF